MANALLQNGKTGDAASPKPPRQLYRKLPAFDINGPRYLREIAPAGREGRCARLTGHTLRVVGDKIECKDCGATWQDFGID